jgi:hypothetical protein
MKLQDLVASRVQGLGGPLALPQLRHMALVEGPKTLSKPDQASIPCTFTKKVRN